MASILFTAESLKSMSTSDPKGDERWDSKVPGLGVRIAAKGTKSFFFRFPKSHGYKRGYIGRFPIVSVAKARETASRWKSQAWSGKNLEEIIGDKVTEVVRLHEALDIYFSQKSMIKNKSNEQKRCAILRDFKVKDKNVPMTYFTKQKVHSLLNELELKSVSSARNTYAYASHFFKFCVEKKILSENPAEGFQLVGKPLPRERVLTPSEIGCVWRATYSLSYPGGLIVRLLMLTGKRLNEVAGLRWSEISDEAITLPGARTKSKREHRIPLTAAVNNEIQGVQKLDEEFVFPSLSDNRTSFSGFSKMKRRLDELSGVSSWRLHDLRHTFVTYAAELGASEAVTLKITGHAPVSSHKMLKVYNNYNYREPMIQLLNKWAENIEKYAMAN